MQLAQTIYIIYCVILMVVGFYFMMRGQPWFQSKRARGYEGVRKRSQTIERQTKSIQSGLDYLVEYYDADKYAGVTSLKSELVSVFKAYHEQLHYAMTLNRELNEHRLTDTYLAGLLERERDVFLVLVKLQGELAKVREGDNKDDYVLSELAHSISSAKLAAEGFGNYS